MGDGGGGGGGPPPDMQTEALMHFRWKGKIA